LSERETERDRAQAGGVAGRGRSRFLPEQGAQCGTEGRCLTDRTTQTPHMMESFEGRELGSRTGKTLSR